MPRRVLSLFAALLALVAVHSAWAVPWVCLADVQARACVCDHAAGTGTLEEDCCTRGEADASAAPGVNLPSPHFAGRLAAPPLRPAPPPPAEAAPPLRFASARGARAPPATPLFLSLRTLLI